MNGRHENKCDQTRYAQICDLSTVRVSFRMLLLVIALVFAQKAVSQSNVELGRSIFQRNCGTCHGGDGLGGEMGPNLAFRQGKLDNQQLSTILHDGLSTRGMPAFPNIEGREIDSLIAFIRTIRMDQRPAPVSRTIRVGNGEEMNGLVMNEGPSDMQFRSTNGLLHLLRRQGENYREVTSQTDWPTYNGAVTGNRYSTLHQITKENVSKLVPKWIFPMEGTSARNETTPVVVEGIMYITSANECWALDAGSGREIWHFQRPRISGLIGNAAQGMNRGVAWLGSSVFLVTDNAHLLALNRFTGDVVWETEMADWHQNYNATSAPLIADNLVISGTAGGEQGVRGFLAAYDPASGREVWRFWTAPKPGDPGSETWIGKALEHPSAVTWMTGSFDPELDTLFWTSGNPGPDFNGDERKGDNLYSDCILALDPKTGKLKWYYQATPHDVHDWDASEPLIIIDGDWKGSSRKLLLQANRNGFLYVLDRQTGHLLMAKPFVQQMNWAKEVDKKGRPVELPLPSNPNSAWTKVCPALEGATNWFAAAYDPETGYYLVQTLEACSLYLSRSTEEWQAGRGYSGGAQRNVPDEPRLHVVRAIDVNTGKIAWEYPEVGHADSSGGILAFGTGILIFGADDGMIAALDSSNGKLLWEFQTNVQIKASPMTYVFDGKQIVAIDAGQTILAFGLSD
jgi:alcohol dehydrogenase (cytochrome c)